MTPDNKQEPPQLDIFDRNPSPFVAQAPVIKIEIDHLAYKYRDQAPKEEPPQNPATPTQAQ